MNKRDYQREMEAVISGLEGRKPRLLMHACCAPCSSAVLERVTPYFETDLYYYDPNIEPFDEYIKRRDEFPKLLRAAGLEGQVRFIEGEYDNDAFHAASRGLEGEREGGERCPRCFELRLRAAAELSVREGYEFFCTTLTVSPHKDAQLINTIGEGLSGVFPVRWLPSDFKKRDGYLRSIRLSHEYGLYRQCWCGCLFAVNAEKASGK